MSVTNIKQLFLVGFLGLALVGCSSTPKTEEGVDDSKQVATEQVNADIEAAKRAAAEKAAAELAELKAKIEGKVVYFDFDRSEIKSEFYETIKANADYMALETGATVTIKGHCDERGTREYNLALGERRGNAVKNALIAEGVSPSRINVISYGEDSPVAEGHNEAAWAKNRRAEFSY
jgi:peptidoglycan-associated lipoprotein